MLSRSRPPLRVAAACLACLACLTCLGELPRECSATVPSEVGAPSVIITCPGFDERSRTCDSAPVRVRFALDSTDFDVTEGCHTDGRSTDDAGGFDCAADENSCNDGWQCCSGFCNFQNDPPVCSEPKKPDSGSGGHCKRDDTGCQSNAECCSGHCLADDALGGLKVCSQASGPYAPKDCGALGQSCIVSEQGADCCGGNDFCEADWDGEFGTCRASNNPPPGDDRPPPGDDHPPPVAGHSCEVEGTKCNDGSECCTDFCNFQ